MFIFIIVAKYNIVRIILLWQNPLFVAVKVHLLNDHIVDHGIKIKRNIRLTL